MQVEVETVGVVPLFKSIVIFINTYLCMKVYMCLCIHIHLDIRTCVLPETLIKLLFSIIQLFFLHFQEKVFKKIIVLCSFTDLRTEIRFSNARLSRGLK